LRHFTHAQIKFVALRHFNIQSSNNMRVIFVYLWSQLMSDHYRRIEQLQQQQVNDIIQMTTPSVPLQMRVQQQVQQLPVMQLMRKNFRL
jgi:hypothetical protein